MKLNIENFYYRVYYTFIRTITTYAEKNINL